MTDQVVVYKATNTVNGHSYIGVTKRGLDVRERQHKYDALRGRGFAFHAAIRKHGPEAFVFEQIGFFADDYQLALMFEQEAIAKWSPEYNVSLGGEGRTGPMPEAHKQALSRANKGKGLGRKGLPLSEEHKQRLREANVGNKNFLGRKHTEETKARLRAAHLGRVYLERRGVPRDPTTVEKIRAALKGRPSIWRGAKRDYGQKISEVLKGRAAPDTPARLEARERSLPAAQQALKKPVLCLTDGREFPSAKDAARFYGLRDQAVAQSIRRGHKTRSGLHFAWKEPT